MAETVFRELTEGQGSCEARSAGLGAGAVRRLTTRDLAWADVVAVMEPVHLVEIRRYWPAQAGKVLVLGVPDDYDPGEPELRALLWTRIRVLADQFGLARPRTGSRQTP
jgi:predicted protein tyrosine phosphatase